MTTADERSWKFDRSVLFLGEWCRLYGRKPVWEGMDAIVAAPYGLVPGQKERDLAYILQLTDQLQIELVDVLNRFHKTNHGLRYWQILLGHWLRRYVEVVFNRYCSLEQALNTYNVSGTTSFECVNYSLVTSSSLEFIWAACDDIWNHVLYARIIKDLGRPRAEYLPTLTGVSRFRYSHNSRSRRGVKGAIRVFLSKTLSLFCRTRDAYIASTYLTLWQELKLQISFGQFPQLWDSPALEEVEPDPDSRRNIRLPDAGTTPFERFARTMLSECLPTCYLEGYESLLRQTRRQPWPEKPRFIFVSNRFDTDEIFKAWVGQQVGLGTPYIVGQHGNNFGTLVGSLNWPELRTCDRYLTWGWQSKDPKHVPAFIFKTSSSPIKHDSLDGGLLLIEFFGTNRFGPEDSYFDFGVFQEEQFRFVAALPRHIHDRLTVRIHPSHKLYRWFDEQRWADRSPSTHLETRPVPINCLIADSRLVVHAYDSTGILETLSMNIPTMCFWHGGLQHLDQSAKPYYEMLRCAGILHDSPECAAKMVAAHWNDLAGWWNGPDVQNARQVFCQNYARVERKPIQALKQRLTEASQKL